MSSLRIHAFVLSVSQELRTLAHTKAQKLAGQEGELPDGGKAYLEDQTVWHRF